MPQRVTIQFVVLTALCSILAAAVFALSPTTSAVNKSVVIPFLQQFVLPEPGETRAFLAVLIAAPAGALLLSRMDLREVRVLPFLVAALFAWMLLAGELPAVVVHGWRDPPSKLPVGAIVVAAGCAALFLRFTAYAARGPVLACLIVIAAVMQLSWRVLGSNFTDTDLHWADHADPIFYVLSQVIAGRTVLVDLPSQYGIFPEFLAPLLRLVGPSVRSVSTLFAAFEFAALACLLLALSRFVRNTLVLLITGLALIFVTGENVFHLGGFRELYLQYWPIRFFWPAVVVLAFSHYVERPTIRRAALVSAAAGLGTLWNADTGLVCMAAFAAVLLARAVTGSDGRAPLLKLVTHALVSLAVVGGGLAALALKGGPLHLSWLVEYQRTFAGLGLMALPIPRPPHPWLAVVGVYLMALVVAVEGWRRGAARRADVLFFLAILGLGLFSYYAWRSHPLNLVTVLWPAVLIVGMLCDAALGLIHDGKIARANRALVFVGLAAIVLPAGSLVARVPHYVDLALHAPAGVGPADTTFSSELAFVRRHAPPGSQCMIATRRQGIYQLQAGVSSPIGGPGLMEAVLQSDYDRIMHSVVAGEPACLFVGVGTLTAAPDMTIGLEDLSRTYAVADRTSTMIFLHRRGPAPDKERAARGGPK